MKSGLFKGYTWKCGDIKYQVIYFWYKISRNRNKLSRKKWSTFMSVFILQDNINSFSIKQQQQNKAVTENRLRM